MKRAFTLIELLVTIAVIAILAALLFPAISHTRTAVKRTTCINNTRQINLALRMYADDHADAFYALTNKDEIYHRDNLPCFYDPPAGYEYQWFEP